MRAFGGLKTSLALALAVVTAGAGFAQQSTRQSRAESEFFRGYYLQHNQRDAAGAVKAYKQSIKLGANAKLRTAVDAEMATLQEELATSDFARLMPKDSLAYVEITDPAAHFEKLAKHMGLTGQGQQASPSDEKVVIQVEDELAIPSDFQISPALFREFKKIRGAAASFNRLNDHGVPEGLVVIHPGDSDLITGILETGVQLAPASNSIGGFPTFNIDDEVWIVKTNRLIVVSPSKQQIVDCLDRIENQKSASLADDKHFQNARKKNEGSAVFVFASPQRIVKRFEPMMQGEMAIARMVLDLDHMQYISSALSANDNGLRSNLTVNFSEDHNSFGYGMIRTVPLSRKALGHVPAGSAAVVGMGLNPKLLLAAQATGQQPLSALDIGREVFANIEELGVFVLPSMTGRNNEIPNAGIVIASSDVEKSESLWNQLLSLPAMMGLDEGPTAKDIKISGVEAREYTFGDDEIPALVIARVGDDALVAGTHAAVEATIASSKSGKTLANDSRAAAFWEANSEFTSKAAFVHVGRALKLAAAAGNRRDAQEMRAISQVVNDLVVTTVVNEAPSELVVQTDVVGLPHFANVIETVAKMRGPFSRQSRPVADAAVKETVARVMTEGALSQAEEAVSENDDVDSQND